MSTEFLNHIRPTELEKALIEQYNKAMETIASVANERDQIRAELEKSNTTTFCAKTLLKRCLDTGSLRTDTTRQLWFDINEFLK